MDCLFMIYPLFKTLKFNSFYLAGLRLTTCTYCLKFFLLKQEESPAVPAMRKYSVQHPPQPAINQAALIHIKSVPATSDTLCNVNSRCPLI
ncbi:hypothetical protein D3C75_1261150 [compost metagenome]